MEIGVFLLNLLVTESFPFSVTDVDYGIKGRYRDIMKLSYILGCFHGAGEGTAVDSMESFILECLTGQVYLMFSGFIQRDVGPAAKNLAHVPGCLAVTHQVDSGHHSALHI
jgi:hypothetical protein